MTTALCETRHDYELIDENDTYDVLTGRVAICKDYSDKKDKIAFGEYLLYEGKIEAYELELALYFQKQKYITIGVLAVQEKFLDDRQLCVVLDYQRLRGKGLFGEIAVELEFLSKDDVDTLLEMQEESHIRIGEVLILLGAVTREDMEEALEEFLV
ncbi:MAG: hypothetical protein ACUZ8N_11985 [Candidatus Scalindua sp.]